MMVLDDAIKTLAQETNMQTDQLAETLRRAYGGPMTEAEIDFLQGIQKFIDFAIRNGLSFRATMAYMSHDWNEFARYGFDFEAVMNQGFSPRVSGFSKIDSDAVGEPE
jgi:hypothetical protein